MRCCLPRPSLSLAAAAACLLALSASAAAAPGSERVLVVGADAALLHPAVSAPATTPAALAASFSPAGLAQLAMDALGLPTGSLLRLSSDAAPNAQLLVQSPVQADVFKHVDAYAMVFVDRGDADVLAAVDASASGYHKVFDLTADAAAGPSTKIPVAIAREFTGVVGARVRCAGSEAVCARDVLPAVDGAASLERVYSQHKFLDASQKADAALAEQLAQTQQLTRELLDDAATPHTLVAVGFDGVGKLSESKRSDARKAIATQVQELLAALQTKYPRSSGAQVVASASTVQEAAVSVASRTKKAVNAIVAYSRMLLSFNEKIGSSSLADDDDDDDDDDDLTAVNGTKSDVTIEDIAEYQIVLWTSVLLGAVLVLVIIAMCNMNNRRDSLLYAKFTTSNAGRKFD